MSHATVPTGPPATAGARPPTGAARQALLLSDDADLVEAVHQAAAAGGVAVHREPDPTRPPPGLVLVGADAVGAGDRGDGGRVAVALGRGRSAPVHLLTRAPAPDGVFRAALRLGATSVLELPTDRDRLAGLLADLDLSRAGRLVAVVGGSGGVGASTVAAALALRAGASTLLVDLDDAGPGLGRLVGGPATAGATWADLAEVDGRLVASELRAAVPQVEGLGLLTWPDAAPPVVPPAVAAEVVAAGARAHDLVVVDLPRARAGEHPELLVASDLVVLVVASGVPGVAAASRTLSVLRAHGAQVRLVVRTTSPSVTADEVARVLGTPCLATVGSDRRLAERVELGLGPLHGRRPPLARAADAVLAAL